MKPTFVDHNDGEIRWNAHGSFEPVTVTRLRFGTDPQRYCFAFHDGKTAHLKPCLIVGRRKSCYVLSRYLDPNDDRALAIAECILDNTTLT